MEKYYQLIQYIKYKLNAKNEHSVHSPFVFNLLQEVIYNTSDYYCYKSIEALRNELLYSKEKVKCIDLGAGSMKGNSEEKKVSNVAKFAAKPAKYSQLLFRLVNYFQPQTIVELGTSFGISTAYMACANSLAKVITIEGCAEVAAIAEQNLKNLGLKNIKQIIGNFDDVLPNLLQQNQSLDFVFFDGNHRKNATLKYFEQCLNNVHNNSVFVFDDIYWSSEMTKAWNEIKKHPQVTITLDLYFLGIVFFRKEQVKQHFVISF